MGQELVKKAIEAKAAHCHWLHVDHERHLGPFYKVQSSYVGILNLKQNP